MLKPDSLRDAVMKASTYVRQNPDCLHVFIDRGAIVSTLAPSLSFEYRYTLNLVMTDYGHDMDLLMVTILHWLRKHQPGMMASQDKRQDGFTFEIDFIDKTVRDISIELKLTERVIVKEENGALNVTHLDEPPEPYALLDSYQIYIQGEKVAEWAR
ncbi:MULTISPECIES: phage tail protein [Yersinia]|uniref:phage tail protein n=1 Tax=Yersinia TaxID=629 RepID=UPI000EAD35AB|nr:phage tail protein [Yersinia sp. IP36721]